MPKREGPEKRPDRGRRHDPEPQHPPGRTRTQPVNMIDMGGVGLSAIIAVTRVRTLRPGRNDPVRTSVLINDSRPNRATRVAPKTRPAWETRLSLSKVVPIR